MRARSRRNGRSARPAAPRPEQSARAVPGRERPDELTNWNVSSDSLALWLAHRLNAERLIIVKSCELDAGLSLQQCTEAGVLDQRFASLAEGAAFPIDLVHREDLQRVRSLLIGEGCGYPM